MPSKLIQPRKKGASVDLLNPQQQMFVGHLLADDAFNPSKAAEKAGYKPPFPQAANKLMRHPTIQKAVGKAIYDRQKSLNITAERVLGELALTGFADPREMCAEDGSILSLKHMPEAIARAISSFKTKTYTDEDGGVEVTTEIRFWDKIGALNLIAKHLGMLDERLKVEHGVSEQTTDLLHHLLETVEGRNNVIDTKFIEHKEAQSERAKVPNKGG